MKTYLVMPLKVGVFMWGCLLASKAIASATDIPVSTPATPRIASTSLCGDGYLLAFAPDHINGLSWQSRDKLSRANNAQKALPQLWDDAERIAGFETDIILFGPGEGFKTGVFAPRSLSLAWGEDTQTMFSNAEKIIDATSGDYTTVERLKTRLSHVIMRAERRSQKPRILYLSRSAGTAGTGTFIDEIITLSGGTNIITRAGWFTPSYETILTLNPDIVITSYQSDGYESVQAPLARHAAIRNHIAQFPQIDIPGAIWPCAGPGLIEAAERISDALDQLP